MAKFGDVFSRGLASFYGPTASGDPSRAALGIQTGGRIFDYYQTQKQLERDEEILRRQQAQQQRIMAEQLDMARRRAGEETSLRQGIVSRTQQLEQALNQAREAMGQAPVATQDDITQNYEQIRGMMRDDYFDTMDRVSSQGFADAIAKGMDRSDRFRDTQRELGQESAEQLRKIDQEAYNAAISRLGSNLDVLYKGRENRLGEIEDTLGAGISNLQSAMPTNAGTLYGSAQSSQDSRVTGAQTNVTDTNKVAGEQLAGLGKDVAPNLSYMLGRPGSAYTNPDGQKIKDLEDEIKDLRRRNKNLSGLGEA